MNDMVSSMEVYDTDKDCNVEGYSGTNYVAGLMNFNNELLNLDTWNDRIRSFKLSPNCAVALYKYILMDIGLAKSE